MACLKCLKPIQPPEGAHYSLHPQCFIQWFNIPRSDEFVGLQRRSHTTCEHTEQFASNNTSFFHGQFKKYSATLHNESYILKMRQEEAPELPEVEYLCNQIGKALHIPVAEFYFIRFNNDNVFVTKNFIKPSSPVDLQHIHHFRSPNQHNVEALLNIIAQKTECFYSLNIFIKTLLYDALIGNHDRHGRNLGFLSTAKGMSLSPIYDNVSYLSLEKGEMLKADFNPTGRIGTKKTDEPSMRDYIEELKRLNKQIDLGSFYRAIRLPHILHLIDSSFCSALMKEAFKKLIQKRYQELKDELSS
ncbi:MAG TPA: HipA domain-containing protein [Gammaproteobacteria bacterium]|nr:HipA domain-containing protein [Gammaproteobacteria bacterium]